MREIKVSIPANSFIGLGARGQFVRVNSATADFRVRTNLQGPDAEFTIAANQKARFPQPFEALELINETGSIITATLIIGEGDFDDTKFVGTVALSGNAGGLADQADVSIATVTTALVVAARVGRREVMLSNLAANTREMRFGTSSAGAARGAEVPVGATLVLETEAAVYAYNPHSSAQSVGVLETLV